MKRRVHARFDTPDNPLHRLGIVRVPVAFVNAYLIDITPNVPGHGWVLVDTGLRALGSLAIRRAAARRYGARSQPRAIVLTHGHFDHAGSAQALAVEWDVPVFAHPLELPYLTGRSEYPPQDPTVGGALGMMSRAFPRGAIDLGRNLHPLAADGTLPFLPGWHAVATPGHTPGHLAFWRESDRVLLAGDALATMNQESWATTVTMPRTLRWPPAPMTTDWDAAGESIRRLAALRPRVLAAGHGLPLIGPDVPDALATFARTFTPPEHGRYVGRPVRADGDGIVAMPPPVGDPVRTAMRAAAGVAAIAAVVLTYARRRASRPIATRPDPVDSEES